MQVLIYFLALHLFLSIGCQTKPVHIDGETSHSPNYQKDKLEVPIFDQTEPLKSQNEPIGPGEKPVRNKVAIILGPGGARTFAYLGVLDSFSSGRVPVDFLLASEWGSFPAALYSRNGQSTDSEWQAMKLSDDLFPKQSYLNSSPTVSSAKNLQWQLASIFHEQTIQGLQTPFACLSFDLSRKTYFFRTNGKISETLSTCMVSPPFFNLDRNTSAAFKASLMIDFLKRKGMNTIIFINGMPQKGPAYQPEMDAASKILWTEWQIESDQLSKLANYVIELDIEGAHINSFSERKNMISKGRQIGQKALNELSKRYGF